MPIPQSSAAANANVTLKTTTQVAFVAAEVSIPQSSVTANAAVDSSATANVTAKTLAEVLAIRLK